MSRFEQLPAAVRYKIFGYLLTSEQVRQPPDHSLVEHYVFEVNVLRVNCAINKEATTLFYQKNTFIKVSNDFVDAEKSMRNHEVPFFKLKGKFKHHVTDITIQFDPMNRRMSSLKSQKPATFLLLMADIPKFTRLLRLLNFANFMGYQFDFKLHQPPFAASPLSIMDQVELLLPFEQVRGCALSQNVSFSGAFDPAIVKRVKQAMTQKIAWLRAGAWEIHDIALSIKRMGDWAFRLNNADMALAKYNDVQTFGQTTMTLNSMMGGLDHKFDLALCGIKCTTAVDTALVMLSDAVFKETGERMYKVVPEMTIYVEEAERMAAKHSPIVPNSVIARFYYLLGIAQLGLEHPIKAAKAFAKAYKVVPDPPIKTGYDAAEDWKDMSKKAQVARLNTIFAVMPKEPLVISDMKVYATPEVESEHWVMRELGYQGPIPYEDKIKGARAVILTNKPHPNHHNQGPRTARVGYVKPEVLRKRVERYRKEANKPLAQGRLITWVGLNVDNIGEETLLDQSDYVEATKNMNLGGSGCAPQ